MNHKRSGLFCFILSLVVASSLHAQQISPPGDQAAPSSNSTQWPQRLDSPDGLITVYEPQPTKFEGDTLTARAAVSLTPAGSNDPQFGAMWFTARVFTDRDARSVVIQNVTIKQVKLPDASADQEKQFGQVVEQHVPGMNLALSLDQLEATLGVVQKEKQEAQQLDNTPPKIIFTTTPTTLVVLDGPPKLQATQTQGVMAVVNTPFILLFDMASKRYFLKAGDTWMVATDVTAPWAPAGKDIPPGVLDAGLKLASETANPPQATPQPTGPTQILVAEEPTELISSSGEPQYAPIVANDLLYMTNTQSDVFLEVSSQTYYTLLSGRWFSSKSLQGPWAFSPADKLPPSFAQIPADSPKGNVLASVAGTQQAKDARMDAYIPQTTAVRRDSAAGFNVTYDGDPQFVPVQNTPVTYASNCDDPVLCVDGAYYCCNQAVWYRSAAPVGPWALADSVPQAIYTLPPSCPLYNCRYCYVYDSTPDVVYCGYLPGYTGCYVYGPTVVYGTGYQYPYWYHTRFIPHPYTWGFGARYDYNTGGWGYGASYAFGTNWLASRPERHDWFGPQGFVDYHNLRAREANEHITIARDANAHAADVNVNRINLYNRQENVKRNLVVKQETIAREQQKTAPAKRELPPAENNVYVGQDGQVYRKTDTGWESRGAKGWTSYHPTPVEAAHPEQDHHTEQTAPKPEQQPHDVTPGRIEPAEPVHQEPAREPAHTEQPARVEPTHVEPTHEEPAHVEPSHAEPAPGGLEGDYSARERGSAAPPERSGGGGNVGIGGGGGGARGGGGGGTAPGRR